MIPVADQGPSFGAAKVELRAVSGILVRCIGLACKPTRTVGGNGAKVIGICGRGAAVLDAIGLVIDPYQ